LTDIFGGNSRSVDGYDLGNTLRHPNKISLLLSVLVVLVSALPAIAQEATPVGVDTVIAEPLNQTVPVIGRLIASKAGVVASRAAGPIAEMKARVGDRVEKGDIIAVLVKDVIHWKHQLSKAEAERAEAALKTAEAVRDLRAQELKRLNRLKESAAFSQARLEDKNQELVRAISAVAETKAGLAQVYANLKLAEINLYNVDIRAPYAGVISKRHTDVGAYVAIGSPVINMIDDKHLEIEASVPSSRIDGMTPGTVISFRLESGHSQLQADLPATVRAVVPEEDAQTRTQMTRFIPNFNLVKNPLAANQSVILKIPAGGTRDVVSVHKDAVLNRKGNNIVYIVEDGVANIRPVTLGEAVGTRFVVLGGLAVGDLVVVRGNERLRPGQKVSH